MAKRKFIIYQLCVDDVYEESNDYRFMFIKYQRASSPKTLYGIREQGEVEVIFSK